MEMYSNNLNPDLRIESVYKMPVRVNTDQERIAIIRLIELIKIQS